MPKPRAGEDRAQFVDRCMGDGTMVEDFRDGAQRLAVCSQIWRDRDKGTQPMKTLDLPLQIKELQDNGSFEGLASVYGNIDLGGDVVAPGAFKEMNLTSDGFIRILDGHNVRLPIGKGIVTDTHVGLAIKGKLNLAVSYARNVYELMKDKIIDGLSIGYDVLPGGSQVDDKGVRTLSALKLWEVSVTAFPMNPAAKITAMKQREQLTNIREYEDFLREVGGFSKSHAKVLARAWNDLPGSRREADEGEVVVHRLEGLISMLKRSS